jgi:hypothetical protein
VFAFRIFHFPLSPSPELSRLTMWKHAPHRAAGV